MGGPAGCPPGSPVGVMAGEARWGRDGLDVEGWGGSLAVHGQVGRLGLACVGKENQPALKNITEHGSCTHAQGTHGEQCAGTQWCGEIPRFSRF
eukprot:1549900-Pyramimonas_sp.AAC.1